MNRILIVDDHEEVLYLLRTILERRGYTVDSARHGAEALVIARTTPPNIIVSDILMPVMDGFTLCRHWKMDERLKHIPFVFYTATYTEPKDEQLALSLGADAFILKPAEPDEFMACLEKVLAQAAPQQAIFPNTPKAEDKVLLKEYNEVLVHKLEEKMFELEQTNIRLEQDLEARKRDAKALELSERNYRQIFNATSDGILIHEDDSGKFVDVNEPMIAMYGYPSKEEFLAAGINLSVNEPPYTLADAQGHLRKAFTEAPQVFEWLARKKNGDKFWVEVSLSKSQLGDQCRVLAVVRDITERKRVDEELRSSLAEKVALLQEVHHRVKNNLQIVISLLNLQAERINDPKTLDTLRETRNRIRSMALLHESLYGSNNFAYVDFARYVESLCAHIFRSYGASSLHIEFRPHVARVKLNMDQAIPCGLIINELVTNALKHAFPDGRPGVISLDIREADELVVLTISDNGAGIAPGVDIHQSKTLGIQLVTSLTRQLRGAVEFSFTPGLTCEIRFKPLT